MNLQVLAVNSKYDKKYAKQVRPLANFHHNFWSDMFDHHTPLDEVVQQQKEQEVSLLKENIQKELLKPFLDDPKKRLHLLDAIGRLGVAYHFEEAMYSNLQDFFQNCFGAFYEDDLHYVSLRFRLLRQYGFYISCDIFNKFKHENGSFMECLKKDIQGILSLYEASQLRLHGETILDEALAFTKAHLTSLAPNLSSYLGEKVTHALKRPYYKSSTRLGAKNEIKIYEYDASHNEDLLRLAKLDFNLLQLLHRKELSDLISWTRKLDFRGKFPFARDRTVETCFCSIGVCHEPNYSYARSILTKFCMIITVMDDIYDSYGTIDELEILTYAFIEWNDSCLSQLPDCMKFMYQIVFDTFQDLERELAKEGQSYAIRYLHNVFKENCKAYLQEARWRHENYIPTYNEYIKTALVSCGYSLMIMANFQGMGKIASKEALEWLYNSKALNASCIIFRIFNDMAGHKFEKQRDHVASSIDCYMSNFDVSQDEAYKELEKETEEKWKDIRAEMFQPTNISIPLFIQILNACKTTYDLYEIGKDGFTSSEHLKSKVEALLIEPAI